MKQTLTSKKSIFYALAIIFISFTSCENKTAKTNPAKNNPTAVKKPEKVVPPKEVEKSNTPPVEVKKEEPTYQGSATYYHDQKFIVKKERKK